MHPGSPKANPDLLAGSRWKLGCSETLVNHKNTGMVALRTLFALTGIAGTHSFSAILSSLPFRASFSNINNFRRNDRRIQ